MTAEGTATRALELFVAVVLFALMLLTCVDVLGRYSFNSPVPGASELVQFAMGLLVFGALPLVTARRGHVIVGLLEMALADRVARLQRVAASLTGAIGLGVLAWRLLLVGFDLAAYDDTSSFLRIPLAPMAYAMAALSALAAAIAAAQLVLPVRTDHA